MLTPFGKKLRKIRIDHSLTLKDLAVKIGCSSAYISSLERGKRRITNKTIEKLGKSLVLPSEEEKELHFLAGLSDPVLKIDLYLVPEKHREVAIEFSLNFLKLSDENLEEILDILLDRKKMRIYGDR